MKYSLGCQCNVLLASILEEAPKTQALQNITTQILKPFYRFFVGRLQRVSTCPNYKLSVLLLSHMMVVLSDSDFFEGHFFEHDILLYLLAIHTRIEYSSDKCHPV